MVKWCQLADRFDTSMPEESNGERSGRPVVDPDYAKIPQPIGSLGDAAYTSGPHELIPGEKRPLHGGPSGDVYQKTDSLGNTDYFVQDRSGNVKTFKDRDSADDFYDSLTKNSSSDQYAHGGTVIQHFDSGGMAGIQWDQDQSQGQPAGGVDWDSDKYGGASGELTSGVLGALRGATLSGSDVALTRNDTASTPFLPTMDAKDIQGYQDTNPKSSFAGELSGVIGTSIADPLSPAALIGKAGKAVSGGVEALDALKAIDRTTTVGKILGATADIAAHTAGSAVEGSLYSGIGNSLNEYALGDPSLNGEKLASNFGHGAILGGVFGGALKAAEIGVPEAVTAAKDGVVSARNYLFGEGGGKGESGVISNLFRNNMGDTGVKIADAIDNRAANLSPEERTGVIKDITDTISSVYKNVETSIKKLNQTIRPEERDVLINTAAPLQVVKEARQGVIDVMNKAFAQAEERPALYDPGPIAKLEMLRDDFVGQLKGEQSQAEIHEKMIEAKQQLQSLAYTKTSSTAQDTKALIDGVWGHIRDVTHDPDLFGLAGSSQAAHDAMLSEHYEFTPPNDKATPFRKAFMEKTAPGKWQVSAQKVELALKQKGTTRGDAKLDLLDNWWKHIQKLPEHLENTFQNVPNDLWDENKFSKMSGILGRAEMSSNEAAERYVNSVKNQKGRGASMGDLAATVLSFSHPVVGAALEAYNIATKPLDYINKLAQVERWIGKATNAIGSGAKAVFDKGIGAVDVSKNVISRLEAKEQVDNSHEMQKEFASFQADPAKFASKLGGATDQLHSVAPDMAQSLQLSTAKAVQFLTSKLPAKPQDSPFSEPYEPSLTEMAKFERYLHIVEKPTLVFDQVKTGLIGPETMEALNAVYPKLLDQMRQAVSLEAHKQVEAKKEIPYQLKQSISMFLGQPISNSLLPQNVMNNQMVFMQQAQAQAQKNQAQASSSKMKSNQSSRISLQPEANV